MHKLLRLLQILIEALIKVFTPKPNLPPMPVPLTLPHPENESNSNEVNTQLMIEEWLRDWNVPFQYHSFWWSIIIKVVENYPYPASITDLDGNPATFDDTIFTVHPCWDTEGVCAHEMAHISWMMLSQVQKVEFESLHNKLMLTDPYIKLLYSINTYGLTNSNEAHSEVYRYIGEKMDEQLKQYYPRLF